MPEQKGNPKVDREMRRKWLRMHEEGGLSTPEIAKKEGYDTRTVRKYIEMEGEDRERREARSMVLRQALEKHYEDLCAFVRVLDSSLGGRTGDLGTIEMDAMRTALKEHLPRSPIWKNLDKWGRLEEEMKLLKAGLQDRFKEAASARLSYPYQTANDEVGLYPDIVVSMTFHFEVTARGEIGLEKRTSFHTEAPVQDTISVRLGPYALGRVRQDKVAEFEDNFRALLAEINTWKEHEDLRRLEAQWKRLRDTLHDDLQIIFLRRVVPGKCRYCPL